MTSKFPAPQKQVGEICVGWAIGYALKSYQEYDKRSWTKNSVNHLFNPYYIYNKINGGKNIPVSLKKGLKTVETNGVCPITYYNLTDNGIHTATSLQDAAASLYKVNEIQSVYSIDRMKEYLYHGQAIVIGIRLCQDFRSISNANEVFDDFSNLESNGHAICLIGYDDTRCAFKFINSWGANWGLSGYGWISYSMVNSPIVNVYPLEKGFVVIEKTSYDYILGDVDNNGAVTAADARLVLRYAFQLENFTVRQKVLADADGDAVVEAEDARAIQRFVACLISHLPLYD